MFPQEEIEQKNQIVKILSIFGISDKDENTFWDLSEIFAKGTFSSILATIVVLPDFI